MPVVSSGGIIRIEELLKARPDLVFLKPETAKITAELKKLGRFRMEKCLAFPWVYPGGAIPGALKLPWALSGHL